MDSTVSVSKGVFVFKNGFKAIKKRQGRKKVSIQGNGNIFQDCLWYQSYYKLWNQMEKKIQEMNEKLYTQVLGALVEFIKGCYQSTVTEIPTAALLTGINMSDHAAQFDTLAKEIKRSVSPHVAILKSQDCATLKTMVEHMVRQIINVVDSSDDTEDDDHESTKIVLKKSQCNFSILQTWHEELYYNTKPKNIVIIIPDFEGFNRNALQDFIQIVSTYQNSLPIVLVFGVATSISVMHRTLPYHVSSKVNIHVFKSQPSITYLNNILETVLFLKDCPFHLGGKVFSLFTDIFLFYDFSVTGFIQNIKFAMLEHYSAGNMMALCTHASNISKILNQFDHEDFESVRRLQSFRPFVESQSWQDRIFLLEDDDYLHNILEKKLKDILCYLENFHILLRFLQVLVSDLPKCPLGKQVRELYNLVLSQNILKSEEFKDCFQLLMFQSKDEIILKLKKICRILEEASTSGSSNLKFYECVYSNLQSFLQNFEKTNISESDSDGEVNHDDDVITAIATDRKQLKEKILQMSKQNRPLNKYEKARNKLIDYLRDVFVNNLRQPSDFVFHEIFFFNDISIQNNIIGSHRAAIHSALNDPYSYLHCKCCEIPNDAAILNTMPDICVAYKLHLEYGKMINLYDWLQAFLSIMDPVSAEDDDEKRPVDPHLQARFTQCVAELEFLGFIKSSKRKTDHVSRLTWGG